MIRAWLLILLWPVIMIGGSGEAPVGGGSGVTLSDDFDRANNDDISASAPFSWTEIGDNADWDIEINDNELQFQAQNGTGSRFDLLQVRADSDLDTVDQWALFEWDAITCDTCGGTGIVLRTQSGADLGPHIEIRCNDPACDSMRVEVVDGTSFTTELSLDADCDAGEGFDPAVGDYIGASIEGTGVGGTTIKIWDHGASDPGAGTGWGTATCTPTLASDASCTGSGSPWSCCTGSGAGDCDEAYVDTGLRTGLRFYSNDSDLNEFLELDNFSAGDL